MTCIPTSRKIFGGDYFVSLMKLSMGFQCLIIGFVLDLSRGRQNCVYLTTFIDRARGQKKKSIYTGTTVLHQRHNIAHFSILKI